MEQHYKKGGKTWGEASVLTPSINTPTKTVFSFMGVIRSFPQNFKKQQVFLDCIYKVKWGYPLINKSNSISRYGYNT